MTTLAESEITITFDGERIILRPTLRAAMRLERRFEGFDNIIRGVVEQNTGVMAALVEECADDRRNGLAGFLIYDNREPLAFKLTALVDPLMTLTLSLAGVDFDEVDKHTSEPNECIAYAEHFERLYKLGTGYLGWTPEDTWTATPREIMAAYEGRLDMLKAIFGAGEKEKPKMGFADFVATLQRKASKWRSAPQESASAAAS